MMCPCGAEMKESFASFYSVANYNDKGELVLAICHHGYTVIDKQFENSRRFIEDKRKQEEESKDINMKFNLTKNKI